MDGLSCLTLGVGIPIVLIVGFVWTSVFEDAP